jgi:hypothetical protein
VQRSPQWVIIPNECLVLPRPSGQDDDLVGTMAHLDERTIPGRTGDVAERLAALFRHPYPFTVRQPVTRCSA